MYSSIFSQRVHKQSFPTASVNSIGIQYICIMNSIGTLPYDAIKWCWYNGIEVYSEPSSSRRGYFRIIVDMDIKDINSLKEKIGLLDIDHHLRLQLLQAPDITLINRRSVRLIGQAIINWQDWR